MKKLAIFAVLCGMVFLPSGAYAQEESAPTVLTLDQAIRIALSENIAVRVADKDIERAEYARKGTYASLYPQVDGSGSYSRTIKKQVMYMDFDMGSMMGGGGGTSSEEAETKAGGSGSSNKGSLFFGPVSSPAITLHVIANKRNNVVIKDFIFIVVGIN